MTSYLSNGSHKAHAISQGIQLLSLLCCTHFSFTIYVSSTFYIPSIVLGAGDWTVSRRTRFWRHSLFLELPCLGLGMRGRTPHHTSVSCLTGPLSPQMPLLLPLPSLLLHSPCLMNLFLVHFLLSICLFPHGLCLFTCQKALFLPLCLPCTGTFSLICHTVFSVPGCSSSRPPLLENKSHLAYYSGRLFFFL